MLHHKVYPFYFTLGTLILYTVFFVLPAVIGLGYAFTDWNRYSSDVNYVGLDNFKTLMSSDYNYTEYARNTFIFTLNTIVLKTVLGLAFALLLHNGVKHLLSEIRKLMQDPNVAQVGIFQVLHRFEREWKKSE